MPGAVAQEQFEGRVESKALVASEKSRAEIPYVVRDAAAESDVYNAVLEASPAVYKDMVRKSIEIREHVIDGTYRAFAIYQPRDANDEKPDPAATVVSFDTGGGTQHITSAKEHIAAYGKPWDQAQLGSAIGFDGEHVQGVDIVLPVFNFTFERVVKKEEMTPAYFHLLFAQTATVNDGEFHGFAAGEVLFLGASGTTIGTKGDWKLTFRFSALKNQTGLKAGDIAGISKKGWEYLWVQYQDHADPLQKLLVKKPIAAYVERVYDSGAFLGLKT